MPVCCICSEQLPRASFSKLQLRKESSNRKCRECVSSLADTETAAGEIDDSTTPHQETNEAAEYQNAILEDEGFDDVFASFCRDLSEEHPQLKNKIESLIASNGLNTTSREIDPYEDFSMHLKEHMRMYQRVKQHILSGHCSVVPEDFTTSPDFDELLLAVSGGLIAPSSYLKHGLTTSEQLLDIEKSCDEKVAAGLPCPHAGIVGEIGRAEILNLLRDFSAIIRASEVPLIIGRWADSWVSLHGCDSLVVVVSSLNAFSTSMILRTFNRQEMNPFHLARICAQVSACLQVYLTIGVTFSLQVRLAVEMGLHPGWLNDLFETLFSLHTDRQVVRFLAKRIPCHCLDKCKNDMKESSTSVCIECDKRVLSSNIKRCSGCRVAKYCSIECQKKNWHRIHKEICSMWKSEHESLKEAS